MTRTALYAAATKHTRVSIAMSTPSAAQKLQTISSGFHQSFVAVRLLLKAGLIQPCLVVIYSTIDAISWLAADRDEMRTQERFVAWVDEYLLPASGLGCTAIDLYAARCGVLHSFSAESELARRGKAKPIYYAMPGADPAVLASVLPPEERERAVCISITDLESAVVAGWNRYAESLNSRPQAVERVLVRGVDLLGFMPTAVPSRGGGG